MTSARMRWPMQCHLLGPKGFVKFGDSSVLRILYSALGWKLPLEQSVLGAFQAPTGPMRYRWPGHQDNEGADRGQKKKLRLRMTIARMSQPRLESCLTKKRAGSSQSSPVILRPQSCLTKKRAWLQPVILWPKSCLTKKRAGSSQSSPVILWPQSCLTKKRVGPASHFVAEVLSYKKKASNQNFITATSDGSKPRSH